MKSSHIRNKARTISSITYEESYTYYIKEIFNSNLVMLINRLCIESNSCPDDLRNNYPLHSLLIKTSKELLLNQLELVYLSLYFDNFGWKNSNFDIMDNFLIVALSVKKYLNHNTDIIEHYLSEEYPDLICKFNMWLRQQRDFHSNIVISPRVVNERFNLLNRPYNTFCKNNFIDYNESVDKILQMSLPYNETFKQENGDEGSVDNDAFNRKGMKKKKGRKSSFKSKGSQSKLNNQSEDFEEEVKEDDDEDNDNSDNESSDMKRSFDNQNEMRDNNDNTQANEINHSKLIKNLIQEHQEDNHNIEGINNVSINILLS